MGESPASCNAVIKVEEVVEYMVWVPVPPVALGYFLDKAFMKLKGVRNQIVECWRQKKITLRRGRSRQASIDDDLTKRAARMVAKKNLEQTEGTLL